MGLTAAAFTLGRSIDLIINSAASVNFREALIRPSASIRNSLNETHCPVQTGAGNCPVVQVSTCYVHGFHGQINEANHARRTMDPTRTQGHFEVEAFWLTAGSTAAVKLQQRDPILPRSPDRTGGSRVPSVWLNDTYTFTKWMGEQVLLKASCRAGPDHSTAKYCGEYPE